MAQDSPQAKYTEQYILNNIYDQVLKAIAIFGVGWNGQQGQTNLADSMSLRLDYASGQNPTYLGIAAPGTAESDPLWQIRKLTFDGNNNVTAIKYADGSTLFNKEWDDRDSLTYV